MDCGSARIDSLLGGAIERAADGAMSTIWVISGAGRRVGKTTLAVRLSELLPNSVYAKQGHGRPKRGKCPSFFRTSRQAAAFIEANRRRHDHLVIESNALAREGIGDLIVFIDAPPGRADRRRDAEALRARAHLHVAAGAPRAPWRRALRRRLPDAKLRRRVCDLLADQAAFLTRCRLGVRTKIWFVTAGEHVFGKGLGQLLAAIERGGSLRRAAQAEGMSYRYAWQLIRSAEAHLGRPLIVGRAGGARGGGSDLSIDGRRLLKVFRELSADVAAFAAKRFAELYGKDGVHG